MLEKWFKSSALALMLMFVQCTHLRFVHWTHQHQRACTGFESFLSQQDLRIYWPIIKDHPFLKVQLLIFICVQFGCSSMYTFWVVKHQSNTFFDYFVCNSMGSSPTGASPTGSTQPQFTFWCITSLIRIVQVSIFRY